MFYNGKRVMWKGEVDMSKENCYMEIRDKLARLTLKELILFENYLIYLLDQSSDLMLTASPGSAELAGQFSA